VRAGGVRNTVGKLSRRATSLFRPHPNWRSEQRVMTSQSPGSPNGIILGFLLGSPETKSHSDVGATKRHKVYYMGEGGGFP